MPPTTKPASGAALIAALDRMSYDYLSTNAPDLIVAIDRALQDGNEPEGIRFIVQRHLGPDRDGLARRCEQAARYIAAVHVPA
jgi:hypothetical protein